MNSREFYLGKRFEDRKRFPYGFSRSGDFTIRQSEQLEKYGQLMAALVAGEVSNPNDEDKAFLAGVAEGPETDNELARLWLRYKSIHHHLISASSTCKEYLDDEDEIDTDNDDLGDWDADEVA